MYSHTFKRIKKWDVLFTQREDEIKPLLPAPHDLELPQ